MEHSREPFAEKPLYARPHDGYAGRKEAFNVSQQVQRPVARAFRMLLCGITPARIRNFACEQNAKHTPLPHPYHLRAG